MGARGNRFYHDFAAFWPFYVSQHMRRGTRVLHWIGSTLGLACLVMIGVMGAAFPLNLLWIPGGLVVGYGFAWVGHFVVEKNRPATFYYPLWSFVGDWKMWALMLTGRMGREVEKVQGLLDAQWVRMPDRLVPPESVTVQL